MQRCCCCCCWVILREPVSTQQHQTIFFLFYRSATSLRWWVRCSHELFVVRRWKKNFSSHFGDRNFRFVSRNKTRCCCSAAGGWVAKGRRRINKVKHWLFPYINKIRKSVATSIKRKESYYRHYYVMLLLLLEQLNISLSSSYSELNCIFVRLRFVWCIAQNEQ